MKQKRNPTRRAFALSYLALAAFGLSSFATVSAAEPGKRAAEVKADKKSDEEPAVRAGSYKSATGDDKGALREKIGQQAPVTIVRGALTELSEKRMDDLLTSLLKVRKKAKPVDKEDADFYNEQAAFAMP